MYCKKCGAALPNEGYICLQCGTMMDRFQITKQKDYNNENKEKFEVNLLSDRYSNEPIKRDYRKFKENKYLGAFVIFVIVIVLIIIAILKVM